jgi:hypothetical protein
MDHGNGRPARSPGDAAAPLLEARNLTKRFLHVQALDDVGFRVFPAKPWPWSATTAPASRP